MSEPRGIVNMKPLANVSPGRVATQSFTSMSNDALTSPLSVTWPFPGAPTTCAPLTNTISTDSTPIVFMVTHLISPASEGSAPRVSLRPSISWSDSNLNGSAIDSVRQVPVRVDLNYNWEGGKWHPFVGTGLGAYFMQLRHNGQSVGDSETKLGLNVGGGVEYFFHRTVAFKGEGRY